MSYHSVTVDTVVWIKYLGDYAEKPQIQDMLEVCRQRNIKIYTSSRAFNFDTTTKDPKQTEQMRNVISNLGALETPAPFILADQNDPKKTGSVLGDRNDTQKTGSMLGTTDFLSDLNIDEREAEFISVVGCHPTKKNPAELGSKASNHIGDYDALRQHYINDFGVFLTYDTHLYFTHEKRLIYKEKLGLIVMSPSEFLKELID